MIGWADYVVASGEFHMNQGHPVLWSAMEHINKTYLGVDRIEIGPNLMTAMIMQHFQIRESFKINKKRLWNFPLGFSPTHLL